MEKGAVVWTLDIVLKMFENCENFWIVEYHLLLLYPMNGDLHNDSRF